MSAGWAKPSEKKFGPELDDEYVIETSYKFQIWPFLSLTPDPQLLLDPAKNPDKWLAIHLIHSTRAMCPSGTLDKAPKKDLGVSAIYFFKDGFSYLDLKDNTVTMKFAR